MRALLLTFLLMLPFHGQAMGDERLFSSGSVDIDLTRIGPESIVEWDGDWWFGGDYNKMVVRSRGEVGRQLHAHQLQLLYSRYISHFWDVRIGMRYDHKALSGWLGVVGLDGLAPYGIETGFSLYLGGRQSLAGEIELAWPLQLTQQWVVEPYTDIGWSGREFTAADVGVGINLINAGLIFRYEFHRHIATYIDIYYATHTGSTRSLKRMAGEDVERAGVKIGLRLFNW